ncbi:MAG TPA: two-component regulator propeller domain-containing protein [Bacteroidia bacterium]|jgi:ligand-binding sensor domain-containing protein/serine phosphatase RsbU (regulator of sigma subunit)|nr:two-component regulator propeller domain-containing protein [Bacteroidia bacterium]
MKRHWHLSIFLLLFCAFIHSAYSQQYNFKYFGTKEGLIGSNVNSIFQDSRGYVWFGTQTGISRFDGKAFKNFSLNDGLIADDVTCINEDKQGNIWIGTTDGVSEYDGVKFRNYSKKEGLGDMHINSIFIDDANTIWFATDRGGASKYNGKEFEKITSRNGLLSNTVFAVAKDTKGNYWFATNDGISKYDGSKITNFSHTKEVGTKSFYSILVDSKGNLWFAGTAEHGFLKYNGSEFEKINLPEKLAKTDKIFGLLEDKNHNIWLTTDQEGILKYDGKDFTQFDESNGLSSNQVYSISCDYEGNIWIGTTNGGADLFNNESFSTYTGKQGLSSNKIGGIHMDRNGALLIGTQGLGLNVLNANKTIVPADQLKNANIISINQNKEGDIYAGVVNEGVYVLKKEENHFTVSSHIAKAGVDNIVEPVKIVFDKKGNTWIGDFGSGLFCVNKNQEVKNYSMANGLPSNNIVTLFLDSKDNLWIGTSDIGVLFYDGTTFTPYSRKVGLVDKFVWSITENDKGVLFFGTQEKGICCYDGKKFTTISTADGLCSNFIEAMEWDPIDKCIWAGTEKGINRIKLTDDLGVQSVRYYGENEGFKGGEVSSIEISKANPALVWFGSNNGLCAYNRKFDVENTTAPKLILTDILLAYRSVDWKKYTDSVDVKNNLPQHLTLPYTENHLTFHFKALTTDKIMYSFMMEGQDTGWSPLSSSTEANFSNITPGRSYTFKVKAINSNGISNTIPVSFTFSIRAPWWQTWWFYTLAVVIAVISIFSFINYRTSKIAKEKAILEQTVSERTRELSESNKNIKDSIVYAKRIQNAILPSARTVASHLPKSFILYKPKDIVAGDFYWMEAVDNFVLFAACDCTGHGVPGAMVSVVCNNALYRAVRELGLRTPDAILTKTAELVIDYFAQSEEEINDGMDISFCCLDPKTNVLTWAGANNPLWLIRKGELTEIKADKHPIAHSYISHTFNAHRFELTPGDKIYIFSDGFADQFGGENKKKLTKKRFRELILSLQDMPMVDQKAALDKFIVDFRKNIEQTDDILVMGVEI